MKKFIRPKSKNTVTYAGRDKLKHKLERGDRNSDLNFLKGVAVALEDEDAWSELRTMICNDDPGGLETVVILLICIYHLRKELIAWETEKRRPGLSAKQYARITLQKNVPSVSRTPTRSCRTSITYTMASERNLGITSAI